MSANMNDIESVLKPHVKRTPEVPEGDQRVLLWCVDRWIYTLRDGDHWIGLMDSVVIDGQYWLPLPTFDPSEVQE